MERGGDIWASTAIRTLPPLNLLSYLKLESIGKLKQNVNLTTTRFISAVDIEWDVYKMTEIIK